MRSLSDEMKKVSDDYWLYAKKMDWDYVMTLFMQAADKLSDVEEKKGE